MQSIAKIVQATFVAALVIIISLGPAAYAGLMIT